MLEYCRAGRLEPHIRDVVKTYVGHRDIMLAALARHLPGARCVVPQGGYYLWLRLPDGIRADRLAVAAARRGVRVLPASQFYATAGPATHVRLAYSYASASEIAEGVRRLAQALEEAR